MMGQQRRTESLFYYFRLEEQIPTDHLLRLIDGHVDFSFVRGQLKDFYSPTGRPNSGRLSFEPLIPTSMYSPATVPSTAPAVLLKLARLQVYVLAVIGCADPRVDCAPGILLE